MLTPLLPYLHFSYFGDTCNLGSDGSTKVKESLLSLIPFWKAALALVLECYVVQHINSKIIVRGFPLCIRAKFAKK
jgi:hypothetical protein